MIVVTGGSGFIGSALIWGLNQRGEDDIIVVDSLDESEKWKNLRPLRFAEYLDKAEFIEKLESGKFGSQIAAIFHMGACSSTTETNAAYLVQNNYRYTARLGQWHEANRRCRFIYASSAATYGDGALGCSDNEKDLEKLRPLNMYGYSKSMYDCYARRKGWLGNCVGLKYFNVYGPNEYHKADMRSVVNKAYPSVRDNHAISLFKSYRQDYADGEQRRDFLYIKDAVAMTLFFLVKKDINGIFNIGTGIARSWNDIAHAMFKSCGINGVINYIPMPPELQQKYQYHTCADINKLRSAGCEHACMSLEKGIEDYIVNYLARGASLGDE